MLPNFLGIGTQRAATTWLYNCLREHPEVYLPEKKELLFFSKEFEKGLPYYEAYFTDVAGETAVGEVSPEYLYTEGCSKLIAEALPGVKMIVILREPVSRALSAYNIFGKDSGRSFEEAIEKKPGILTAGLYYEQLVNYFSVFDREQFLILLYEELRADNRGAIFKVYDFLGVDANFKPSWLDKTVNTVPFPVVVDMLHKIKMSWVVELVKNTPLDPVLRKFLKKSKKRQKTPMSPELQARLISYYEDSNRNLAKLLDIDLACWERR